MKSSGLILLLSLVFVPVHSEIHRYVDENGNVHFTDKPPSNAKTDIVEVKLNTYESPGYEFTYTPKEKPQKVIMYSTSWCGYCKKAKKYFQKNKIAFSERDIEKSEKAKREYDKLGGKAVPVILIGDNKLQGFSEGAFEAAYHTNKEK